MQQGGGKEEKEATPSLQLLKWWLHSGSGGRGAASKNEISPELVQPGKARAVRSGGVPSGTAQGISYSVGRDWT